MTDRITLGDIERATKTFAEQRTKLAELMTAMHDDMQAAKRRHLAGVKRQLGRTAEAQTALHADLEAAPGLFVKPRTLILHGVKIGFVKAKGKIAIADDDRTVALIRRYLPDQAETLIRSEEKPHKPALTQLSVADLKRIGCTVTDTADEVVIKGVDSEVDKMVDALLKDAVDAEAAEEVPA